ncbi:NRDE family protein [Flavobacterium sp. Arc3]|uniref:NRDE family protein n=1 Tax=Flavobacterium sp. Arc3 TaxID=3046686 RepID=UPI00352C7D47
MCTVSFIPLKEGFLLTSNRDEKSYRPTISPQVYSENEIKLLYPKDEKAGGTWIVARNDGTSIILLNGAFTNHTKQSNYNKSRGIILIEIVQAKFPLFYFQEMDLENIEPFTLIIFQLHTLTEVKWDGNEKHVFEKSIRKPHIWSSATLYSRKQKNLRKQWFEDFCRHNEPLSMEKALLFHATKEEDNTENGLVINREDKTKTVSITQLLLTNKNVQMTYVDRINNETIEKITF